jgi:transcriptional regulator with XRE-family HTH domain
MNNQTFGERLKAVREAKGLSQNAVARVIEAQAADIGFYEKNMRSPSIDRAIILSDYLNFKLDELKPSKLPKKING